MKVILIISCVVLLIIILIIIYTCDFFHTTTPPAPRQEKVEQTPETNEQVSTEPIEEEIEPTPTLQEHLKTPAPAVQEEKLPVSEELFEYLTEHDGHTYYISKNKAKWMEAAAFCEENGGYLVTITSIEENKALIAALKEKKSDKICG
jgi:uncharacterized membrane protein